MSTETDLCFDLSDLWELDYRNAFRQSSVREIIVAPDTPRFSILDMTDPYLSSVLKDRESLLGCGIFDAFPESPSTYEAKGELRIRASMERVLATLKPDKLAVQKYDVPIRGAGGEVLGFEERYWTILHSPIFFPPGSTNIVAICERVDDVTQYIQALKNTEEAQMQKSALEEHAEEMRAVIMQRSAEIAEVNDALKDTNRKLEAALTAAEAASRAKEEFQANISHEIRTPLNAVIGFAQLLGQDPHQSPEHREQIQAIRKAGEHLLELINQVLDAARLGSGKMMLQEKHVSPLELLHDATQLMSISCQSKGLKLSAYFDPSLPSCILVDPLRMRQMVLNLLGNAVKYTLVGEVWLSARAEPIEGVSDTVRLFISVKDTGPGIDPEEIPRLFSRYTQPRGRAALGGTGLGLAIANDLARMMNGYISLTSNVGVGSEFILSIVVPVVPDLRPAHPFGSEYQYFCSKEDSDKTIVIVDDVETNRQVLRASLGQLGFKNVLDYCNGLEAVQAISKFEFPPSIILMDLYMPKMNGYDAAEAIRRLPWGASIPIIAVSASDRDSQFSLHTGLFRSFLSKPFSLDDLIYSLDIHGGIRFELAPSHLNPLESANTCQQLLKQPVPMDRNLTRRFLVVDDNTINQKVAEAMLTRAGFVTESCHDGQTALKLFVDALSNPNKAYDVVLVDKNMPEMDGLETARRLRAIEKCYDIDQHRTIILCLTADAVDDASLERFKQCGMDGALTKPAKLPVLMRAIDEAMTYGRV